MEKTMNNHRKFIWEINNIFLVLNDKFSIHIIMLKVYNAPTFKNAF